MKKFIPLLCLIFLYAGSASAIELYGEMNVAHLFTKVDEEEFNPSAIEARLGAYLEPQVGLEVYFGTGVADDTHLDIDMSLSTIAGVNLRFESPESDGMKIFILLGYGMSEWDLVRSNTGEPGKVDFDDVNYGAGFEWRLGKSKHWFVNLRGQRFLNKDDLSLDTGSLGVRYVF